MWMDISTGGIGKMTFPISPVAVNESQEIESGNSFADIMALSGSDKTDGGVKPTVHASDTRAEDATAADARSQVQVQNSKYEQRDMPEQAVKTDTVNELSPEENEEALRSAITEAINKISHILQKSLGYSKEDMEALLETLGFVMQDMFDVNNVQALVLKANNASEVDLLLCEPLVNLIADINHAIENVLDKFGITKEDVTAYLMEQQSKDTFVAEEAAEGTTEDTAQASTKSTVATSDNTKEGDEAKKDTVYVVDVAGELTGANSSKAGTTRDNQSSIAANLGHAVEQVALSEQVEGINSFDNDIARADIIRQVVEAVRVSLSKDSTTMTLQLNPEHLGRVQISVVSKNGIMQAQIIAENKAAQNAIESNIALLQEALEGKELKVESVEVMIASYDFFEQQEQQSKEQNSNQTGKRLNLGNLENLDEAVDEVLEDELLRAQGSSIHYSI